MEENSEISEISFGILSPDEIKKIGVCEITSNKLTGPNSVYDERMGVMEGNKSCIECGKNNKDCSGHFGYATLNYEILHPLYFKIILSFLKCFCYKCSSILIKKERLELNDILKYKGANRFNKIIELTEKIDICSECNTFQPKYVFSVNDNNIFMNIKKQKDSLKVQLIETEIKKIFENIPNENISLLGFNPKNIHPKNFIISVLPILPPVARPYIIADGITCDDDLTLQYLEIIKVNNHLGNTSIPENKRLKYIQSLKFRIKCLFDNSQDKARHTNGRPLKGFKKRLAGKEGQIRNNLMGKRVNKSGRTVIGPDPTLKLDEIAIPKKMASILSLPVSVNRYNQQELQKIINNNEANFVNKKDGSRINLKYAMYRKGTELLFNDIIHRGDKKIKITENKIIPLEMGDKLFRNNEEIENLIIPQHKKFEIHIGDTVERKLKNGDILLLNRQPTLHKGSMLAQKIVIRDYKTIRMNLAITKTFNADFDGDEMNIHVPASCQSEAELRLLSSSSQNLVSSQSSKSSIVIVQDSLLGSYMMTKDKTILPKGTFFQISMSCDFSSQFILQKIKKIKKIYKKMGKKINESLTGKGLFSLLLPDDFFFESKNKGSDEEPILKIFKGILYEGVVNKSVLGGGHNSLIQTLTKEYGIKIAVAFINNVQFIANSWLMYHGFSVGVKDCIATKKEKISESILKCFIEARAVEENTKHEIIKEAKINSALNKARDLGMKIAKDAMDDDNNFLSTVNSGSKGDYFNIAQITGLLGQQNFSGKRIEPSLNKNTRSLPHYPFKLDEKTKYEAKGFIKNSFYNGLNPKEFFFHAITGREGITDTAMKTAQSGYVQRRMIKVLEDSQVQYDGTVRNANGNIIQLQYGDDGLDASKTLILDNKPEVCDISRISNKLNILFEENLKN